MNEKNKKLTLQDIIVKKAQKEQDKFKVKEIYIPSLGGNLIFEKLPFQKMLEMMDNLSADQNTNFSDMYEMFQKMIYTSCDTLKTEELHKEYGILDPYDIIPELFSINEVIKIGNELTEFNGFNKEDEIIKN